MVSHRIKLPFSVLLLLAVPTIQPRDTPVADPSPLLVVSDSDQTKPKKKESEDKPDDKTSSNDGSFIGSVLYSVGKEMLPSAERIIGEIVESTVKAGGAVVISLSTDTHQDPDLALAYARTQTLLDEKEHKTRVLEAQLLFLSCLLHNGPESIANGACGKCAADFIRVGGLNAFSVVGEETERAKRRSING